MTRTIVALALALAGSVWTAPLLGSAAASAQDAPPKGTLAVPEPARCGEVLEPRPVADLARLVEASAGPGVIIGAASPEPDEAKPDPGQPVDAETTSAATETLERLYACYNANDYPRAFALFTDAGLGRVLPAFALTEKDLAFMAESPEPAPAPKEAWRAVAVRQVELLPDGRLRATIDGLAADGPFTAVALLIETGDGLRIDDLSTVPTDPTETDEKTDAPKK